MGFCKKIFKSLCTYKLLKKILKNSLNLIYTIKKIVIINFMKKNLKEIKSSKLMKQ